MRRHPWARARRSIGIGLLLFLAAWTGPASASNLPSVSRTIPLVSPDGHWEVYATALFGDGSGTNLRLRRHGDPGPGLSLRQNNRWMAAAWSPALPLLAVEDHWDGHGSVVYVYEISGPKEPAARLVFKSSKGSPYDTQWFFNTWDGRALHLRRDSRRPGEPATQNFTFPVGTQTVSDN